MPLWLEQYSCTEVWRIFPEMNVIGLGSSKLSNS